MDLITYGWVLLLTLDKPGFDKTPMETQAACEEAMYSLYHLSTIGSDSMLCLNQKTGQVVVIDRDEYDRRYPEETSEDEELEHPASEPAIQ